MSKERLLAAIKAAAWAAAAELGNAEAEKMLQQVAREIGASAWSSPGDR